MTAMAASTPSVMVARLPVHRTASTDASIRIMVRLTQRRDASELHLDGDHGATHHVVFSRLRTRCSWPI